MRGEIQALIGSPELRRIFDEEPGAASAGRAARSIADRRGAVRPDTAGSSERPALSQPSAPRSSRRRRILVGLAPLYLAGVILFFEAVREPSTLLQVFGTPSVAEEPAPRTERMNLAAAAPATMVRQEIAQPDVREANAPNEDARADSAESWETAGETSTDFAPAEAGVPVDEEPASLIEKKAIDLAKHAADQMTAEMAAEADPFPEAASDPSTTAPADDRPFAGLAYPDPRAGTAPAVPIDPAAAEAAEEALRLSRGDRREVQRRLRFADADPEMIDGIFGPATRSAIAAWQEKAGLAATGFLDEPAMAMLVEETAAEFRAWRAAERARAREEDEEQSAVVASSAPPFSPVSRDDECRRLPSGDIAFGQDVGCNFRAFGNNFKRDFRDLKGNLRQLFD